MPSTALEPRAGRRHSLPDSPHATSCFAPEPGEEPSALGVTHPRAVDFAVRAAARGPVGAGRGRTPKWVFASRGRTREDWDGARGRLHARRPLDATGEPTAEGTTLRAGIEADTDRLDRAPYAHLGAAGVVRLTELAAPFARSAATAGTFPADPLGEG
ncbi:hypothetical protein SZN_34557 [Streptomyces zinciresistens K42]|uniref:Uncharacterized protein n=1 Tax=Streptomyces zinciresistens K42 TaxID=700597 RepID=G2GN06_9ACTN|nr:hypothetical protein [Streptomyces zinciresistens]EGX55112.1 hypothetical protein SZN_34557 [Streptomyces zinciresistens K42]